MPIGDSDARVASGRDPRILLAMNTYSEIAFWYCFNRSVNRSVIDDQDLKVFERLGKDALDSLRDEALAVVRWDNDADFRQGGFH